jgi:hypothetical protein
MGICKCKKRTDLFCFNHKKPVCESCILEGHKLCHIRTYKDWLQDNEFPPPTCGLCKKHLEESEADDVIRFLCLDMFHMKCIDDYGAKMPNNTALAGFGCPTCSTPLVPASVEPSPLVSDIISRLSNFTWINTMLPQLPSAPSSVNGTPVKFNDFVPAEGQSPYKPTSHSATPNIKPNTKHFNEMKDGSGPIDPIGVSVASRKHNQPSASVVDPESGMPEGQDDDEDKYRKKSVWRMFEAMGLVERATVNGQRTRELRLSKSRLLLLFVLIAIVMSIIYVSSNLGNRTGKDPKLTQLVQDDQGDI